MEKFQVTILGCGSATPTTRHNGSSQVVNIREKLYMIDCAEGTQVQMRANKLNYNKIYHIFISHLHGDHCFGLTGLVSTMGLLGRTAPLYIWGPKDIKKILQPQLDYFCKGQLYDVHINEIDTTTSTKIHEDKTMSVWTIPLYHRVPCCGYLFVEKPLLPHIRRECIEEYSIPICQINNIKNGMDFITPQGERIPNNLLTYPADQPRSYAYCSDTRFNPAVAQRLKEICQENNVELTLLYHEATFANDNIKRAEETFHSTAEEAATAAAMAGAKRLCIGHYSSRYIDETILLSEAAAKFPETILSKERMIIDL